MAKCPYDGFECDIQTERIDNWKFMVHNIAPKDGRVFLTSADMFNNCEYTDTCVRYINLMKMPPQKNKMIEHKKILVGKIVAPQGIRGEMRVQTFTDTPADFQKLNVKSSKFNDGDFKFVRTVPNSTVIIGKITGVDDRNTAETLRGTELYIERNALPDLKENEYYQADLIGFDVVRNGQKIGIVDCFQNYGAGDIIELDNGDMVSFIGAEVDMQNKTVKVL